MLDRRRSIWEDAPAFVLREQPSRGVRFEDPLKIQEEVDREREEEENREDGHILPVHQSERDATLNLKELISSLTPKKKVGGRKSLHVGAAKGLLGKRPVELDQDDDEEDNNSPKRFRVRDASPVKNVKLPAPPTKDETVGRITRSVAKNGDSTPRKQGLFINAKSPSKKTTTSLQPRPAPPPDKDMRNVESVELQLEPIQLQDFLNMTNIHFMELTTTKRRHTMVPSGENRGSSTPGKNDSRKAISLEDCVAAGFCTVPILELYQHVSSVHL
jgi:kinetochore protein Spc7/SPC105